MPNASRPPERARRLVPAPRGARLATCTSARSRSATGRRRRRDELVALIEQTDRPRCPATASGSRARRWTAGARGGSRTPRSASKPTCTTRRCRRRAAARELLELVARVFATPLDRGRALWELWLVEGLDDGSFALIFKTHHALVDGLAGVEVARAVLDAWRGAAAPRAPPAAPAPGGLLGRTLRDGVDGREGRRLARARGGVAGAARPRRTLAGARAAASGVLALARELAVAAPETPLRAERARAGVRDGLVRAGGPHAAPGRRRSTTCCWRRSRARCGAS